MEILEFLGSRGILGVLLLSGAMSVFLWLGCVSWFKEKPRRFWLVRLTYIDSNTQQMARFFWVLGWWLLIIGAILVARNDARYVSWPDGFIEFLYLVVMVWLMAKVFVALIIFGAFIYRWVKGE